MLYAHPWTLTAAPSARHPGQTESYMFPPSVQLFRNFLPFYSPRGVSHSLLDLLQGFFLTQKPEHLSPLLLSGSGTLFPSEQEGAT